MFNVFSSLFYSVRKTKTELKSLYPLIKKNAWLKFCIVSFSYWQIKVLCQQSLKIQEKKLSGLSVSKINIALIGQQYFLECFCQKKRLTL
jgi:hypothetical protein